MQVISVNRGERKKVRWRLKTIETGIFKYPVDEIELGATDVVGDQVVERKYHGGIDKACYLFSADVYDSWKASYPKLDWNWGMFGENISIEGLNEAEVFIGSKYKLGTALIEVSEPRQPCYKLGIRMGTQKVIKDFINRGSSGVYVRVLESGVVKSGDTMTLVEKGSDFTVKDVFLLLYKNHPDPDILAQVLEVPTLAASAKKDLKKHHKLD